MASSGPVPVTIFTDTGAKKTTKAPRVNRNHKFINKVDGFGKYMRFAFTAETLDQANSILAKLHTDKIIDSVYTHAYSRNKAGKPGYAIHGVAHVCSSDYDFDFLRPRLPRVFFRLSFYPDGPVQTQSPKNQPQTSVQCLQEGVPNPGCVDTSNVTASFAELPTENSFSF